MKDFAYRYSVRMTTVTGYHTPAGWDTRSRVGRKLPSYLAGPPTDAKLARYVADYNASLAPGGVNAHIGSGGVCTEASILDHRTDKVVATWEMTPGSYQPTKTAEHGPNCECRDCGIAYGMR